MISNKKSISKIIVTMMFLLFTVAFGFTVTNWYNQFQSDFEAKKRIQGDIKDVEIVGVKYINNKKAILGMRNTGPGYHVLNEIQFNDVSCNVVGTNVVDDFSEIFVSCPAEIDENYEVVLYSDKGITEKTFTSFEYGVDTQENYVDTNFTITFRGTGVCELWETEIFTMDFINRSHAETITQSNYLYSVCANHTLYPIGTQCSGDSFKRLFELGNITNAHIYPNSSDAADAPARFGGSYYNFQDVCMSSIAGTTISVAFNTTKPSLKYSCIGSVSGSDSFGYVVGNCNAYSKKIWVGFT